VATYRWRPWRRPERELRRLARDRVDLALVQSELEDPDEAVHEVRKRTKELRALLRLVRETTPELYRRENPAFRDLARPLSDTRDAAVMVEAFDGLLAAFADEVTPAALDVVRDALDARRDAASRVVQQRVLEAAREDLREGRERIDRWQLDGDGFEVLAGGFRRSYRRAREAMAEAVDDPSTATWHEWRKRAKDHRYHLELLQPAWKPVIKAQRKELHRLTEVLGDDHDLAVLRELLHAEPDELGGVATVEVATALLDRRRAELQREAALLGRRVFVDSPKALTTRVAAAWDAEVAARTDARRIPDPLIPPGR
jgi:CHAD domain-containing protein